MSDKRQMIIDSLEDLQEEDCNPAQDFADECSFDLVDGSNVEDITRPVKGMRRSLFG
jgi:hypothetical protein